MRTRLGTTYYMLSCMLGVMLLVSSCDEDAVKASIEYPDTGFYGVNILAKERTSYTTENSSFQAKIPEGQKLKVIITALNPTLPTDVWYLSSLNNWAVSTLDVNTYTQVFQSIDGGLTSTLLIYFYTGSFKIDYYENDDSSPTATKTIEVTE